MANEMLANNSSTRLTAWDIMTNSSFDPISAQKWMADNWHRSIYLAAAYLLFIRAGHHFMRDRPAYQLTRPLIIWNVSLMSFSLMGAFYTWPEFIWHLKQYGYFDSYCVVGDYYRTTPTDFWAWAFHFSKAPELGDTVFLILRKRPIQFLHVYHHTTVLLWCWYCFQFWSAPPRWGVAMNYAVHAAMYAYYTTRAIRLKLPSIVAPMITSMQLVQFLICVPLNAVALYKTYHSIYGQSENVGGCDTNFTLALLQQFLYNTYFLLFARYFYNAYLKKGNGSAVKED